VHLRKEHVHVERRPADRPASEADLNAFREGAVEMRETSEEAVVQKQARVTGEVVIRKDVEDRTETVRDSVRKTDVQVEKLNSTNPSNQSGPATSGPSCNP
jgi:stress response protein YsnF